MTEPMQPGEPAEGARGEPGYTVPPVSRAFALLRHIAEGNRCRNVSQTSKALGINRTTLIRLLATLEAERIVERAGEGGGYRLGTGLIALASEALNQRGILQIARPLLKRLVKELGLSAHFGMREGTRLPAHATTIGRILLAELPPETLRELYSGQPLGAFTDKTRTSLAALEAQLVQDRAAGMSWSSGNFEPEIGSAAVAVHDHLGQPAGAINVTGHVS